MIAILSDIHANLPALEAVLADMRVTNAKWNAIWLTGDYLGGMPHPCETMDRLMALSDDWHVPVSIVLGNHDQTILELHQGMHPEMWQTTQWGLMTWTVGQLQPHHWAMLEGLQQTASVPYGNGQRALLFHGRPQNIRAKILEQKDAEEVAKSVSETILACGHSHQTRMFRVDDKRVINVGSVSNTVEGLGGHACYVLLDETTGMTTFRYVGYDVEKAIQALRNSSSWERASGVARAWGLEMRTGRQHLMGLVTFANAYAERELGHPVKMIPPDLWLTAEQQWDGSEWLPGRAL